jgi:hypothetical protein
VKEFRLQTRPWTWVTFNNVSLRPGQETDFAVQLPDSKMTTQISGAGKVVAIGPAWEALRDELGQCYRGSIGGFSTDETRCAGYFEKVLSWTAPGDTFVLMFAFDKTAAVPAQYQDLLPLPWSEIESRLGKGEQIEAQGMARGLNVVLLAGPTLAQLNTLIRRTPLLAAFRPSASEQAKAPGSISENAGESAAKLPNGVTVRFLAYSQLTAEGLKWWNAEGEPASIPGGYEADVEGLGTVVAFQIDPPQADVSVSMPRGAGVEDFKTQWQLDNSGTLLFAMGKERSYANILVSTLVKDPPEVGLIPLTGEDVGKAVEVGKFGVAQIVDLQVVSEAGMPQEAAEMMGLPPRTPPDNEMVRSMVEPPIIQFTVIKSPHSSPSIVAVEDKEGLAHELSRQSDNSQAATYRTAISPEQLASLVIEASRVRQSYVTFRNLSLTPDHVTKVQTQVNPTPTIDWWPSQVSQSLNGFVDALDRYVKDQGGRLPASLAGMKGYLREDKWLTEHLAYIAKDGLVTSGEWVPVAYDKTLLPQGKGTYVVFGVNSHSLVQFKSPRQLAEIGIPTGGARATQAAPSKRHNMQQLGLAVVMYANDHNGDLPATLAPFAPSLGDAQVFAWLNENVIYTGNGNVKDDPSPQTTVIACEAAQKTSSPAGRLRDP